MDWGCVFTCLGKRENVSLLVSSLDFHGSSDLPGPRCLSSWFPFPSLLSSISGLSLSTFPQSSAGSPQSEAVCVQGLCVLLMHTHWSLCVPYGIHGSTHLPCEVCMVGGGGKEGQLEGQWLFYFYWPVAGGHSFQSLPSALPPQPAVCGEAQGSLAPRGLN